jgi:flagellar assembly factor FliW
MQIQREGNSLPGYPIPPDTPVRFPHGIPGFEQITAYCFRASDTIRPFMFMEALASQDVNFICVDAFALARDYRPRLRPDVVARLGLDSPDQVAVLCIVTVGTTAAETTANLLCPLVINRANHLGEQVILDGSGYPMQLPLSRFTHS